MLKDERRKLFDVRKKEKVEVVKGSFGTLAVLQALYNGS